MPILGIGTWTLCGQSGEALLCEAIHCGYRLIDTAQMYENEEMVGRVLRRSNLSRSDIFLTSKLCRPGRDRKQILRDIDLSLKRLQTSYLDLMLIHGPYPEAPEMYRAMEEAMKLGKLKAIGISNFYSSDYQAFLKKCTVIPAIDQVELHLFHQRTALRDMLSETGTQIQAWSPLTSGMRALQAEPLLTELAERYQKTPHQIALRFLIQQGISVIPRTHDLGHLAQNLAIFDFRLDDEDQKRLATLNEKISYFRWNQD